MTAIDVGQVIAVRAGEIADESDSEDEGGDHNEGDPFWLCVVVQKSTKAEKQGLIKNTNVQKNEQFIIVRWLEKDEEVASTYSLSHTEECIAGHRVEGLITVKTLGKIRKVPSLNASEKIRYKLHKKNIEKIMAATSKT